MTYTMIPANTILLVDAVRTIITSDAEYNIDTWGLNKDLAEFLKTLPNHIIVVTNAAGVKLEKIQRYLSDYEFEIVSMENNPPKTDPTYFQKLLGSRTINPTNYFYFDHKQENLDAAKQASISGVLFENNDQIISYLQHML